MVARNGSVFALPFLNISNKVLSSGAEQGLLGLAFPTNFSTGHHFYVDYTRQPDGAIVISRFFVSSTNVNVAATNSEQVVLVIPKPAPSTTYNNHNAGQLAFGPDGYLYIGVGDGGSETDPLNNGQTTTNMFGKILRIDVESGVTPYAVPASNPFVSSNNYVHEIWAYGLRNPWRFSFDDQTGDLYIGDVGQNNYEEIDFQPAGSPGGQNYGWRIMEGFTNYNVPNGFTNFSALTLPVTAYSHSSLPSDGQGAVIGGYVYRGPNQPRMNGMYFYGDYAAGWIWGLKEVSSNWQSQVLFNPPSPNFFISTFGEDDNGQIYLADYHTGKIYQLQDTLQTCTPTFSPPSGIINSNMAVVTCLTTNAEIHYTTNGLDPTISDPIIASGASLLVTSGFTNKAWAFRSDLSPSAVARAVYTFQAATPLFSPSSGPITNGTPVSISCGTPGATIYYTTNGTTPTTSSSVYAGPVVINGGMTIEAMAVAAGYLNSSVRNTFFQLVQTATPVFSPASGPLVYGTNISISCATPGSTIYYTLDGTTPTTSSPVYSGPLTIYSDTTLSAFATTPQYLNSAVQTGSYTLIKAAAPVFTPPQGPFTNNTLISISTATSNAIIYYTIDGSTPTTNSAVYSAPILFTNPMTLSAGAKRYDLDFSPVNSTFYGTWIPENTVVTTVAGQTMAGFTNGYGSSALFSNPEGICIDQAGNLYVTDTGNGVIRKISSAGLTATTFTFLDNGKNPIFTGICIDFGGNIYVADNFAGFIYQLPPAGGFNVAAFVGSTNISGLAVDGATNLYLGLPEEVGKILPNGDGSGLACCYVGWGTNVGIAIDVATNVYAATGSGVWIINPLGAVTLFAGSTKANFTDGPRLQALFQGPQGAAIDSSTNIFVSDNNRIRKISFTGQVSTLAGNGINGYQNGPGYKAEFNGPIGICVDTNGNVFVADSGNNCIREISPDTAGIGIADGWQLKYFGHVGIDPNSDPNGNGMTAYEDFWAGLNPTNPASVFKIENASMNGNGTQISWDSVLGKNYTVQWSSDLVTWNNIGNPVPGNGTFATIIDSTPGRQNQQRFYRVLVSF
jgi:sugar lactone lactonase YvrE